MHPGLFGDLGKKPRDLLSDDFSYDMKLEVKSTADHGVGLTSTVTRDHVKGGIVAAIKAKFRPARWVGVDTTIDTAGKVQAVATLDTLADGLKVKVDDNLTARTAKVTVEYVKDKFTVGGAFDLTNPAKSTVGVVVGHNNVAVGVEVVDLDIGKAKYVGQYAADNLVIAAAAAKNGDDLILSYAQDVQSDLTVAAKYNVQRSKNDHKFELGVLYCLDKRTSLRSKIDSNGVVSLVYGQDLRPGLAVKIAGQIDTQNTGKPHNTLGVTLVADL